MHRIYVIISGMFLFFNGMAMASPPVTSMSVQCNWGQVTAEAIQGGFDQGTHVSDPSGDGRGPEKRVGLANVVEQGNLQALCEFISGAGEGSVSSSSQPVVTEISVDCNWGRLTMEAIQNGFDQGGHSADPSGDGLGHEERVGLANIIERGNLQLVCDFLSQP